MSQPDNLYFDLAEFNRWIARQSAKGFEATDPQEVERIRGILRAGGKMSRPIEDLDLFL
mgnify:CR=1 FL=1